jgi:hypothetical protein
MLINAMIGTEMSDAPRINASHGTSTKPRRHGRGLVMQKIYAFGRRTICH